ncbi:MAG: Crp/Fnr family transcriptional regulator, partial [Candidatus Eremiobacteraeota bacterium]|nr:Crp/Fnr family transcriptional regulator [Candidatus Eremiobacteraeota bacterium]
MFQRGEPNERRTTQDTTYRNQLLAQFPAFFTSEFGPELGTIPLVARSTLHEPGEVSRKIYFVESGIVSLTKPMRDGRSPEVYQVGREGLLPPFLGYSSGVTTLHAFVTVAGAAIAIDRHELVMAMAKSKEIAQVLRRYAFAALSEVQQLAACNSIHSIEQRCSRWLLRAQDRIELDEIPITQERLATLLGVQRTGV